MTTIISAIIFVITSGGLFTNQFKDRPMLRIMAASVAIVSALYLVNALSDDVQSFFKRGTSVTEQDDMLDTPAPRPVPTSNFGYSVVDRGEKIDFIFPMEAVNKIASLARGGELATTGFDVGVSMSLSVSCTHWVSQGAGDSSRFGITSISDLLPQLQCNAWADNGDGSSSYVPNIDVTIRHIESDSTLVMTLGNSGVFRLERKDFDGPCVFTLQNQYLDFVTRQDVVC